MPSQSPVSVAVIVTISCVCHSHHNPPVSVTITVSLLCHNLLVCLSLPPSQSPASVTITVTISCICHRHCHNLLCLSPSQSPASGTITVTICCICHRHCHNLPCLSPSPSRQACPLCVCSTSSPPQQYRAEPTRFDPRQDRPVPGPQVPAGGEGVRGGGVLYSSSPVSPKADKEAEVDALTSMLMKSMESAQQDDFFGECAQRPRPPR